MDSKCLSLILLLFFSSCVSNRTKEALDKADSFLSSDPDSALTIVQAIPNNTLSSRSIRARHALLTAEAQDKCHIDEKEDSTILVAYNRYQRNGTKENRLKATYYMGVVRQNAGADIEAALYFKDAEALAEQLQDYRCLSLCEQHLRAIYARNYDQVRARTYAEKSLFAAIQAGDSLMAVYCRLDLAVQDIAENNNPEAERQLLELIETVSDTSQLYSLANLALAKAFLTDTPPEYARARFCYNQVLQRNRVPLSGQDYGHLALLSAFEGDRTTAESYLEEAKSRIVTAVDSTTYFDILHEFFLLQGDVPAASEALEVAMMTQNQIVYELLEQSVTHAMESHYLELSRFEQEKNRLQRVLFLLIGLVLVGVIIWFASHLRRTKQDLLEKMAQVQDFSSEWKQLQSRNADNQVLLAFYSKNTILSMNNLARTYFSWDSEQVRQKELKTGMETKEEMRNTFRKQLASFRKDETFYSSLEQSLNVSHDHLMEKARDVLREEKNIDFDLLTLFFYGFSAKSICFLKDMSEAAVRMRKTRYKQLFASLPDGTGRDFVKQLEADTKC